MKRVFVIIISALVIIILAYLIFSIADKAREQKIIKQNYNRLPAFAFKSLNGTLFSSTTIKSGPVLLIYFHPECEHCQYELSEIFNSSLIKSGIWILMITPADISSVLKFKKEYGIRDSSKIITLIDENLGFADLFGKASIPTNIVYNKELKLVRMYKGEVRPEIIMKLILDND